MFIIDQIKKLVFELEVNDVKVDVKKEDNNINISVNTPQVKSTGNLEINSK